MSGLEGRDYLKKIMYKQADERCEEMGLGHACLVCRAGIPGGSQIANQHHEILPKSELCGPTNWQTLFGIQNIAPACPEHHSQLQPLRLVWMKSMVALGLVPAEAYKVAPFVSYWSDAAYPPVAECLGQFGWGSTYFQTVDRLPSSLMRLYTLANPEFAAERFCETCRLVVSCRLLTPKDPCEHIGGSPKWKSALVISS